MAFYLFEVLIVALRSSSSWGQIQSIHQENLVIILGMMAHAICFSERVFATHISLLLISEWNPGVYNYADIYSSMVI